MKIRKFNESIDDSREWITDFMSDLEIDFPGTEASLYPSKHPSIEPDVIIVDILRTKEGNDEFGTIIRSTTNEDLGWTRKDLLKYIEDKIRFLIDGVDDLSFGYFSITAFSKVTGPTITHDLDLSSGKFTSRFKNGKLNRIDKIRIYLNHNEPFKSI